MTDEIRVGRRDVSYPQGYEASYRPSGRYGGHAPHFSRNGADSSVPAIPITMSRNLPSESVGLPLVMRHIGAARDEADRLRTRFVALSRQQPTDRQHAELRAAGVRRDDLDMEHGVSGTRA